METISLLDNQHRHLFAIYSCVACMYEQEAAPKIRALRSMLRAFGAEL
jgi:hypothetical protein